MSNFFQRLFIGTNDEFANIELDARIFEQFDVSTIITDHPVDTGAIISDHAYTNPEIYIMEGVVSDTPFSFGEALSQIGGNVLGLLNLAPAPASKRSVAAFVSLLEFWRDLTVFDVQTAMGLKEDLMIESMTARVDDSTANILRFTVTLRQVPRIETSLVTASSLTDSTLALGNSLESAGNILAQGIKQATTSTADLVSSAKGLFS